VIPGRPALLGWMGEPLPSRTAPLGMTKTPTLRVSADFLDLKTTLPLPCPSLGVPEREVESRLRPALTLDKPRNWGGVWTLQDNTPRRHHDSPARRHHDLKTKGKTQEERWHCGECLSRVRRGGTWEGGADRSRHTNEHRCIKGKRARRLWSSAKLCKGAACALCKTPNKATK
jgi:hypothetical protein